MMNDIRIDTLLSSSSISPAWKITIIQVGITVISSEKIVLFFNISS